MNWRTLRVRIALWTVALVSCALILFGFGAAYNLRRHLVAELDSELQIDAHDFADEINEEQPNWNAPRTTSEFFSKEAARFQAVEMQDAAGRLLYRSPRLGSESVLRPGKRRGYSVTAGATEFRFRVFQSGGGITYALGRELHDVDQTLAGLISAYLLTLPLLAVGVGVGSWWIARRAVAPVGEIAARAENISASDLDQRLPVLNSGDEIAHLAGVLNTMFERLQESFAQVTRFTSDASHELKTPLALMRAQLESTLHGGRVGGAERELLAHLIAQCSQMSQIVDGLLFLSRADDRQLALEQKPVDLVALLQELREDGEILASAAQLTLEFELPAELIVDGDVRLLRRALMNLLDNAIKYNRPGGRVLVTASREGQSHVVALGNTGPGIPLPAREKIFSRFYRSDPARNSENGGHGLGLSITREITRAHRGEVCLVRSDSDWTEFWLLLPPALGSPIPAEYSARPLNDRAENLRS
ncbi:MAG: HAMP domain-containing histidine kinase [Verrucomicrobiota bacterium]|nr:HAMP domain-containing histidine kinase [Verrucomicrobiota bacterium]